MEKYDPKKIEKKWQDRWEESKLFYADDKSEKPKKYILDMFPYPSGSGLHVGHIEGYTATDIFAKFKKMQGYEVMHPMGWDAFGLPAENYAIKTGIHPSETTKQAIETFKRQMKEMGLSYDWSREVNSSDKNYYRWTQWLFLLFYKNGLAYKKMAKVNWCPSCETVLANEQAAGGVCDRCGTEVIQKDLEQWFFRITDFLEDRTVDGYIIKGLISGLEDIDWPASTKLAQKNWIGRSEGASVRFSIALRISADSRLLADADARRKDQRESALNQRESAFLEVFTTRPDTLFGCTYMVVCPEHELIKKYEGRITNYEEVKKYIEAADKKTELERVEQAKEKTGVKLEGITAINPVNSLEIPIFVADYVLSGYGTGAIMAVPAHDSRDHQFATKFNLPIIEVVQPVGHKNQNVLISANGRSASGGKNQNDPPGTLRVAMRAGNAKITNEDKSNFNVDAFEGDGININSEFLDDLPTTEAKEKMIGWLEVNGSGKRAVNYKIRDWLISRQRYWGPPIPIIYCTKCGEVPVPESDLPVTLPTDVDFKPTGESPLVYSQKFQDVSCPKCNEPAKRESDTMDTFVCSSWYYFRYADANNTEEFGGRELLKHWLPVDTYVGGAEHTVLHLLYSRFFTKALQKFGLVDFNEPFKQLRHPGTILAPDSSKMSKSKGNVINPDEVVSEYGADALRLYEMFMGPLEDAKPWNTKGIIGVYRFLEKVNKFIMTPNYGQEKKAAGENDKEAIRVMHKMVKKVGEDIEAMKFNTAISEMMKALNSLSGIVKKVSISVATEKLFKERFLLMLAPFAPHLAEELWAALGHAESIFTWRWPEFDSELARDEVINLVIQINGKTRDTVKAMADLSEQEAEKMARASASVKKWLEGKTVSKIIYVPGRLINLVIG
jgi:leucyl-tRNA synthetase